MGVEAGSFAKAVENATEAYRKCLLFMRARLPGTAPACAHIRMIFRISHAGHRGGPCRLQAPAGCKPLLAAGLCRILTLMLSPSSHLDVLSVTCPVGELQTPQDS